MLDIIENVAFDWAMQLFLCREQGCSATGFGWCLWSMTVHIKVDPPLEHVSTSAHHVSTQESRQCAFVPCLIQAFISRLCIAESCLFLCRSDHKSVCKDGDMLCACTFNVFDVNCKF